MIYFWETIIFLKFITLWQSRISALSSYFFFFKVATFNQYIVQYKDKYKYHTKRSQHLCFVHKQSNTITVSHILGFNYKEKNWITDSWTSTSGMWWLYVYVAIVDEILVYLNLICRWLLPSASSTVHSVNGQVVVLSVSSSCKFSKKYRVYFRASSLDSC